MNKNILKSIAALTCIAVICAALLIVGNMFLPRQTRTFNYGEYLGDTTAEFSEIDLATLDAAIAKNITAVYKATGGKAAGGYVVKSKATVPQYGTVFEMITGVDKNGVIVKVGYVGVITENSFWNQALTQENFDRFKGKDPMTLGQGDFVTSGATLTTNTMIAAVQAAFKTAVALINNEPAVPTDPTVELVQPYFSQKVTSAVKSETLPVLPVTLVNVTAYDVMLENGIRAWAFIDKNTYYKFNVAPPFGAPNDNDEVTESEMTQDDVNGTFYISETAFGVYADGTEYKFAKLSAKPVGYAPAPAAWASRVDLNGMKLGQVSNSNFATLIGAEAGAGNVMISGATASGVNAVKNVNRMLEDYVMSYVTNFTGGQSNG